MKYKTTWTKKEDIERKWYVVDVKDQILGRATTKIASLLIGKGTHEAYLLSSMANRHGLISGATGSGKTITLKVMAEALIFRLLFQSG